MIERHCSLLALALCVGACGPAPSAPDAGGGPADTGSSDAGIADTGADTGVAPIRDGGQPDARPPFTERFGVVYLEQQAERAGDYFGGVSAEFADVTDAPDFDTLDTEGGSCFLRMRLSAFSRDYSDTAVSAGPITIRTDASDEVLSLDLTGGTAVMYDPLRFPEPQWMAGETLTVTGAGATVPPFEATVIVPPAIVFEVPAEPAAADRVPLENDAPYTIRWTPVPDGLASIRFDQSTVAGDTWRRMSLECVFPAADGTATLPIEVMRALLPTDAGTTTFLAVGGAANVTLDIGGFDVRVMMHMTTLHTSAMVE
jgi:hypothetical protein